MRKLDRWSNSSSLLLGGDAHFWDSRVRWFIWWLSGPPHSIGGEFLLKKSNTRGCDVECVLLGYWFFGQSVLAFWRCGEEMSLWRQQTWKKANSATDKPSEAREHCLQEGKDTRNVGGNLAGEVITPNNTAIEAFIRPRCFLTRF